MIILTLKAGAMYEIVAGQDVIVNGVRRELIRGGMVGPERVLEYIDSGNRVLIRRGQGAV